jgi:nitroimidazol reductase NimA-like FMN-containing flavoprotein (pyridoxamine 5'-phosphate oxidase superfamily)
VVRRLAHHQVHDRDTLCAVLDAGRVAHVAVVDDGQPLVVPLAYARDGDTLLVHGSTGSRAFRLLANGAATCVTVTLLDGYVLARAAFEMSMRYRSAMVLGRFSPLTEADDKLAALIRVSDHSVPGRWDELRPPTRKELAATAVLSLPLAEWSVKVNDGWPTDEGDDVLRPVWAGVLPVAATVGAPLDAPDVVAGVSVPAYLTDLPVPGAQV